MKRFILVALLLQCAFVSTIYAQNEPVEQGMVQIFGNEEGAAWLNGGDSWQNITKGYYMPIDHIFSNPVKAGYVRQYYVLVRMADNMSCGNMQFRFWFPWAHRPGHQFDIGRSWGAIYEGTFYAVQIPTTIAQAVAAGTNAQGANLYWRIDGRIVGCDGVGSAVAKISGIYLRAVDVYQGSTAAVTLNTDGENGVSTKYVLGGTWGTIGIREGKVGIGTFNPTALLSVAGDIYAKKVKVTQNAADWPDYVFHPDYKLPSLDSTAAFINSNRHLPGIPSAQQVAQNGQDLGEMNRLLLQKVEELTLHMIETRAENKALKARVEQLEKGQASPGKQKSKKR